VLSILRCRYLIRRKDIFQPGQPIDCEYSSAGSLGRFGSDPPLSNYVIAYGTHHFIITNASRREVRDHQTFRALDLDLVKVERRLDELQALFSDSCNNPDPQEASFS
jgi:hypothetical protein